MSIRPIIPRRALATLSLAVALPSARAQTSAVTLGASGHISADNPHAPFAESFLAINPRDPANLLATAIVVEHGKTHSAVYATHDGGRTWRRGAGATAADTLLFNGGDPIVYFDRHGTPFFGSIQGTPIGFGLATSSDGGLTWHAPVTIPGGTYDREYLAFDTSGGRFDGRVYAGGTISAGELSGKRHNAVEIVYSADDGRTWSAGRTIGGDPAGEGVFVIADLDVTPDGKLVVPFSTYASAPRADSSRLGHLGTMVSEDGGLTFSPAAQGPVRSRSADAIRSAQSDAAPRFTIDHSSGPHKGRWFFAWMDFVEGRYVARVAHSDDLGKTWSAPLVVNDNANRNEPANPAIAVNRDGVVAVTYNDRRDDPKNSCYRLYIAVSLDGGETFEPSVPASREASCPYAAGNWAPAAQSFLDLPLDLAREPRLPAIQVIGVAVRWPNGGDTQGLVASPDGGFHAAWLNGASGTLQLWSTAFAAKRGAARPPVARREDLSRQLTIELGDPDIDFAAHTLSIPVRLANPTTVAVDGPLTIELSDQGSEFQGMRVANADNGLSGKGASWDFTVAGAKAGLAASAQSDEKVLRWTFTGGPPERPDRPLRAHFVILGRTLQHRE